MRRRLAILVVVRALAAAAPADADADEASLELGALGGLARLSDPAAGDTRVQVPWGGAELRATYATHNLFEYQLVAAYGQTGQGQFPGLSDVVTDAGPQDGTLSRRARLLRAGAGVEARLGVRWVPTIGLTAGLQRRTLTSGQLETPAGTLLGRVPDRGYNDLFVAASLGLDYRINRRWIAGAFAGAERAVPLGDAPAFDAFEAGLRVCYYWYPRWASFD